MKNWLVELHKYPESFSIRADTKEEAIEKAKQKVNWAVFESSAEEEGLV